MPARFDVAGRLAEARPAVDNTQCYVWACHLINYQNPDLTQHSAQVRDWFSTEAGMDLRVLDADCASLHAAATAADHASAQQRDQLTHLSTAWQGAGATSAEDFVRRHCDAAEKVVSSMRTAAEAVAGLRDTLWQIVDTKAAAMCAIDDRHQSERPAWLAAAQTVSTCVGDRVAASELVDRQIKPFVDNDIRVDWLTAVRTAIASIGSSYDAATAGLTSAPPLRFDVPGDFGLGVPPAQRVGPSSGETTPPNAAVPGTPVPSSYPAAPPPYLPPAALPASPMASAPAIPPAGATPTLPGQLNGLPQQFADALRGLLPSPGGESPALDTPALDHPPVDAPPEPPNEEKQGDKVDDKNDCGASEHNGPTSNEPVADAGPTTTPEDPPPSPPEPPPPAPAPQPPPPPDPPVPAKAPVDQTATPCEIAANELPQAGQ
jgi:hypothetical protein